MYDQAREAANKPLAEGPFCGVPFLVKDLISTIAGIPTGAGKVFAFIPSTPSFNVTGQPAMSVPLNWTDNGLPVGMQFVARFGDDATLFRLAVQLEQA